MGIENGVWCLGCCIGFTAVLVALGTTSVVWMAVVGGVIFAEKVLRTSASAARISSRATARRSARAG